MGLSIHLKKGHLGQPYIGYNPKTFSQNYPLSDLFSAHKSHMYTYAHLNLSKFHSKKTSLINFLWIKATVKTWNPNPHKAEISYMVMIYLRIFNASRQPKVRTSPSHERTIKKIKTPAQTRDFRVSRAHEDKNWWFVFLIRVMFRFLIKGCFF